MQTKPTSEPTRSPVAGVSPEPIRTGEDAAAVNRRDGVTIDPPAARRGSPLARLLGHLRGDRYMVGAYPPGSER